MGIGAENGLGGQNQNQNSNQAGSEETEDEVDKLAQSVELRFAGISLEQVRRLDDFHFPPFASLAGRH